MAFSQPSPRRACRCSRQGSRCSAGPRRPWRGSARRRRIWDRGAGEAGFAVRRRSDCPAARRRRTRRRAPPTGDAAAGRAPRRIARKACVRRVDGAGATTGGSCFRRGGRERAALDHLAGVEQEMSGSRGSLPSPGPLRPDGTISRHPAHKPRRLAHRPRVVRLVAPPVRQLQVVRPIRPPAMARGVVVRVDEGHVLVGVEAHAAHRAAVILPPQQHRPLPRPHGPFQPPAPPRFPVRLVVGVERAALPLDLRVPDDRHLVVPRGLACRPRVPRAVEVLDRPHPPASSDGGEPPPPHLAWTWWSAEWTRASTHRAGSRPSSPGSAGPGRRSLARAAWRCWRGVPDDAEMPHHLGLLRPRQTVPR